MKAQVLLSTVTLRGEQLMFPKGPRPQQAKFGEAVPERWRRGPPPFLFPLQPAGTHLEDGLLQVQGGYKDNPVSKDVKEEQPKKEVRRENY